MKNKDGFTMLEVLFAMAIFAVAMLGVIGLQLNAIQTDEETRRKDMAAQLLTAGVEMVECLDYASLGNVKRIDYNGLLTRAEASDSVYFWMGSCNDKARLYYGQMETTIGVTCRNVYLVAAWTSVRTGQVKTLARMMVKPQNMLQ